ncbi:MAG: T9SS type A sorting domain-containing protein [Bacteroidales bacterium]|nr:T9SS type A sorting domain-containing protein [Bacteroidales bacterium]
MKKTLSILVLALCSNLLFAQSASLTKDRPVRAAAKTVPSQPAVQSLFTKDDAVIKYVDFSGDNRDYSTGIITSGSAAHTQNYPFAVWRRIPNVEQATLVAQAGTYPFLVQWLGNHSDSSFANTLRSMADSSVSSSENGFMLMSMADQRVLNTGVFNAFIQIDSIDASQASFLDIRFYQYYMKDYDECFIDYSTDNDSTWGSIQVNVDGIDVYSSSNTMRGFYRYSMPLSVAGSSNLSVRIRWQSLGTQDLPYGYFWIVDDVSLISSSPDRLRQYADEYVEGNYGLIPEGMQISPAWYTLVENNGVNVRDNVTATLHHLNAQQNFETTIASFNNQSFPSGMRRGVVVDKAGWLTLDSLDYRGWYGYSTHTPNGTGINLPTDTLGDHFVYATVSSDPVLLTYDTMYYNVTPLTDGYYRWGHDNGVLTYAPNNYWLYGWIQSGGNWYVTEDPDDVHYYSAGYCVTSRFTTDAVVPEGWVIRGVELVASPVADYHTPGARISPVLLKDVYSGDSVSFRSINTGVGITEVTAADVNSDTLIGRHANGYLELGQYNSIVILFPEQPALTPNTSFRVGYSLEEDAYFALAREALGSYRIASPSRPDLYDTIIYFRNNESTAKYAHTFAVNGYQTFIGDPTRQDSPFLFAHRDDNPMIRLLVGPAQPVDRVNISIECDSTNFGSATYADEEVCGSVLTPAVGSTIEVCGKSSADCAVAHCYVDGVEIMPYNGYTDEGDRNLIETYNSRDHSYTYCYRFANLATDHTIKFVFSQHRPSVGINPVADAVKMTLQPNPATSQVRLGLSGVTGMVHCTLIDMSGREVYSQHLNAGGDNVIDLGHLAKGAYFVRVTNSQFSKVEKLIVR